MPRILWSEDYELGIGVIDHQHQRIVDYINQLYDADVTSVAGSVQAVVFSLVDYTQSHFAFEESLLEDSGYQACEIHKTTHRAFTDHILSLQQRLAGGEDIKNEIADLLTNWLLDHILHDDMDYVELVKEKILNQQSHDFERWKNFAIRRCFGGRYH